MTAITEDILVLNVSAMRKNIWVTVGYFQKYLLRKVCQEASMTWSRVQLCHPMECAGKRSGDGALVDTGYALQLHSGVALRLPPHSIGDARLIRWQAVVRCTLW